MGSIILLALAAAVYPQLLAVVVITLTRPNPQPLLWACYLTGLLVSVGSSILIFAVFRSRGSVAGTSSQRLGPTAYLAVGAIAVLVALLIATRRGRELLDRDRPALSRAQRRLTVGLGGRGEDARTSGAGAQRRFGGGGLPGRRSAGRPRPLRSRRSGSPPRGGDGVLIAAVVMVVFALIKFVLIEIPIAGYTDRPRPLLRPRSAASPVGSRPTSLRASPRSSACSGSR